MKCCNHECEQGRACPYRSHRPLSVDREDTNMKYRIRDFLADLIGVIAIFGSGYSLLLIGHGLGL